MSLAQAVYERWLADSALTDLVPAGRVYSGRAAGDAERPYAVIEVSAIGAALHTTHVGVQNLRVELTGWFDEPVPASQLLNEWRRRYDRQSFAAGAQRCLLMQCVDERTIPETDRGWKAVAVYSALCERPAPGSP